METLILYLSKSSTLLLLFFCTYFFLLKKDTFFSTNRWFLLFGLFCSLTIPLISIEKTVWVEPLNTTLQTTDLNRTTSEITPITDHQIEIISWKLIMGLFYAAGIIVFLTQLLIEFYSLQKIIKRPTKKQLDGLYFIEVKEAVSPFSFFKKIVYNPDLFEPEELENIIEHEKIHARQLHSLDVLIARLYCILFWWNPLVWFYKKAIIQNLEFIADQNALAKTKSKKSYLLTLLKITTAEKHVALTNHFYQSLIKKRIVMLHKNQSKKHHSWKYFTVVPALVFFIMTYQVNVVAQTKSVEKKIQKVTSTKMEFTINATSKDEDIKGQGAVLKKEFGVDLELKKISRNKNGEIKTIRIKLSKNNDIKVYEVAGNNPIKPFIVFFETDSNNQQTFGFSANKENEHLKQHFIAVDKERTSLKADTIILSNPSKKSKEKYENEDLKTSASINHITIINNNEKTDSKKALIILNDNEISNAEMEKINPEKIRSINVLKTIDKDQLIEKYGERAKNGVIFIETYDFEPNTSSSNSPLKPISKEGSFIIHMRSTNSELEFFKKELSKIDINVKISGIERNSEDFITSIKIKLIDEERGQKMSANWITSENSHGIPAISIGRKKDKLILTSD